MSGQVASPERVAEVLAAWLEDHDHDGVALGTKAQWPAEYRTLAAEATQALTEAGAFRDEAIVKAEALEAEATRTYRKGGDDYPFAASEVAAFLNDRARRIRAGESS